MLWISFTSQILASCSYVIFYRSICHRPHYGLPPSQWMQQSLWRARKWAVELEKSRELRDCRFSILFYSLIFIRFSGMWCSLSQPDTFPLSREFWEWRQVGEAWSSASEQGAESLGKRSPSANGRGEVCVWRILIRNCGSWSRLGIFQKVQRKVLKNHHSLE